MLALGVPRLLRNLDVRSGAAILVTHALVVNTPGCDGSVFGALHGRGEAGVRLFALLAGCDYNAFDHIGLVRACGIMCRMPAGSTAAADAVAAASALKLGLPADARATLEQAMRGFTKAPARSRAGAIVVALDATIVEPSEKTLLVLPEVITAAAPSSSSSPAAASSAVCSQLQVKENLGRVLLWRC